MLLPGILRSLVIVNIAVGAMADTQTVEYVAIKPLLIL